MLFILLEIDFVINLIARAAWETVARTVEPCRSERARLRSDRLRVVAAHDGSLTFQSNSAQLIVKAAELLCSSNSLFWAIRPIHQPS